MRHCWVVLVAAGITLLVAAPAAQATMPGMNGKIAFVREQGGTSEIYVMNADGTGQTRITTDAYRDSEPAWSPDGARLTFGCFDSTELCLRTAAGADLGTYWGHWGTVMQPTWAPDGTRVAFTWEDYACDSTGDCWLQYDIASVHLDGTGFLNITDLSWSGESAPSWSVRGDRIAFDDSGLFTIRPDGTGRAALPICCSTPEWSPDGTRIAYSRWVAGDSEIFVANADGSGETQLTANSVGDGAPGWSPDGTKIVFSSTEGGDTEIFVMSADGSGRQALTDNSTFDGGPDWQPLPYPGYARPKGATPLTVSLVPAYAACGAPDRTHGPPLAFGSCGPPAPASSALTVGTPDANGSPARFAGTVQAFVGVGNPATPADEADVAIGADLVDVRNAGDLTDHTGVLELRLPLRVTDRLGGEPATVEDLALTVPVPCAATADPASGAHCAVTTTADAQVPGSVPERARSVWGLEQVRVYDGNGAPFAVQGLFVP